MKRLLFPTLLLLILIVVVILPRTMFAPSSYPSGVGQTLVGSMPINVMNYGVKADCRQLSDITMTAGSNVVHSASYTFVSGDVGKSVVIKGANGATDGIAPLVGTITGLSGGDATVSQNTSVWPDTYTGNVRTNTSPPPLMTFGTDNINALNSAVNAVPASGGTLYIPAGNYFIGSTTASHLWTVNRGNINIQGDGMGQTNFFYDSSRHTSSTSSNATGSGLYFPGGYTNVRISDFTITDLSYYYAMNYSGANCSGIYTNGVRRFWLERVEMVDCKGNSCFNAQGGDQDDIFMYDNIVRGTLAGGYVEFIGFNVGTFRKVHFVNNKISGVGDGGYGGGGNCFDQYIAFNTVDMSGVYNGGLNCGNYGIAPEGANRTTIIGNTVTNFALYGIDITTDVGSYTAKGVRIIGNHVDALPGSGIPAGPRPIRLQNTSGDTSSIHIDQIIIQGNFLRGQNIISLEDNPIAFQDMIVSGNMCEALTSGNLFFAAGSTPATGKTVIVTGNKLHNIGHFATNNAWLRSKNVMIENNMVGPNTGGEKPFTFGWGFGTIAVNAGATVSQSVSYIGVTPGIDRPVMHRDTTNIPPGLIIWGLVTANDTMTFYFYNPTGSTLTCTGGINVSSERIDKTMF